VATGKLPQLRLFLASAKEYTYGRVSALPIGRRKGRHCDAFDPFLCNETVAYGHDLR
jgi:hypothetical protein